MIDAITKKTLHVSTGGTAGPYIMVPVTQLATVREVLDAHRLRFDVDENTISLDGEPDVAIVNLARGTDMMHVQELLDHQP